MAPYLTKYSGGAVAYSYKFIKVFIWQKKALVKWHRYISRLAPVNNK